MIRTVLMAGLVLAVILCVFQLTNRSNAVAAVLYRHRCVYYQHMNAAFNIECKLY